MATFSYIARDPQGNSLRGQLAAATQAEAVRLLRREGKFPIELKEQGARPAEAAPGSRRVRKVEVINVPGLTNDDEDTEAGKSS